MLKYSIIIPVYNAKEYLNECIQSILEQNYSKLEIILVDDGSTDGSMQVCDNLSKKDSRIRVYHNSNHGQIFSRVFGVEQSTGDVILFVDADDSLVENALSTISEYFDEYQCDCVIYGLKQTLEGRIIYTNTVPQNELITNRQRLFEKYFLEDKYNNIWRKATKREIFDGRDYSDYYYTRMGEDFLHSIEIIENCNSVLFVQDVLYSYRVNPASVTQTIDYQKYRVDYSIREYALKHIINSGYFDNKSYGKYCRLCKRHLFDEIIAISRANIDSLQKYKLFQEIQETEYYKTFLSQKVGYKMELKYEVILFLFSKKLYGLLLVIAKIKK